MASKKGLYREIEQLIKDRESKEQIIEEVKDILDILEVANELYDKDYDYWINQDNLFTLNTTSWQVCQAEANGHYKILSKMDTTYPPDMFLCENLDNGKKYLCDKNTIIYLQTVNNQDLKFIYVGICGDYEVIDL